MVLFCKLKALISKTMFLGKLTFEFTLQDNVIELVARILIYKIHS